MSCVRMSFLWFLKFYQVPGTVPRYRSAWRFFFLAPSPLDLRTQRLPAERSHGQSFTPAKAARSAGREFALARCQLLLRAVKLLIRAAAPIVAMLADNCRDSRHKLSRGSPQIVARLAPAVRISAIKRWAGWLLRRSHRTPMSCSRVSRTPARPCAGLH